MRKIHYRGHEKTADFVERSGIDTKTDIVKRLRHTTFNVVPVLVRDEGDWSTSQHVTKTGADYDFSRLDYVEDSGDRVIASRMVATILAKKRTELAYWTQAAPVKQLSVHKGMGALIVGNPEFNTAHVFRLDPDYTPEVTLPSGRFYTIAALEDTPEPLVVSGLYEGEVDFSNLEKYIQPGQKTLTAPEGKLPVQVGFRNLSALDASMLGHLYSDVPAL